MAALTWQGVLLFGCIPLVLFLFLRQPIGPLASVLVGLALMFGHRLVAAPWAWRHAPRRCFWCGRSGRIEEIVEVRAGGRAWAFGACGASHRKSAGRLLAFVAGRRVPIGLGIFAPLIVLIAGSLAAAAGRAVISHDLNALQFRLIVALTVVGVSIFYRSASLPPGPLTCWFPIHNLALLGIRNTLWVFRLVGAWWILSGLVLLARLVL